MPWEKRWGRAERDPEVAAAEVIDFLVTHGHPPDAARRYTVRQLRLVMDAVVVRLDRQAEQMRRRR